MRPWIFFVAKRYLFKKREHSSSVPNILSILGIATGVMTLLIVLGVMNGFQHTTIEAILELNSYHLRISGNQVNDPPLLDKLGRLPQIRGLVPFRELETLIQGAFPEAMVAVLRFVPEDIERLDPSFRASLTMVEGTLDLTDPRGILLGSELARFLGVSIGDPVQILDLSGDYTSSVSQMETLIVKGIWQSGHYEFDASWGFLPLPRDAEAVTLGIKLRDRFRDQEVLRQIEAMVEPNAEVVSWREYNRAIFGALRMEKTVMLLLIGLIFLVVGANIYRSQQRLISERLEEISLLLAVGAAPTSIQRIFLIEGAIIGLVGGLGGNILGFYLAERINSVFRITESILNTAFHLFNLSLRVSLFSPADFYISEIRAVIPLEEAILVTLIAVVSTTLAAYAASFRVVSIYPVEVLRYE